MANWRKVIVSGSDARLSKISVGGVEPHSSAGSISASGKIFASTSVPSPVLETFNVLVQGANGEFNVTGSDRIAPSLQALTIGGGLTGTSFNGSSAVTITLNSSSLAGAGLDVDASGLKIVDGGNITVTANAIAVDTASLVDTTKGLTADSAKVGASSIGVDVDGSTVGFNASGQLTASFVAGANLSAGNNISLSTDPYTGAGASAVSVDVDSLAGTGLDVSSNALRVSGSNALTANKVIKWDGHKFVDSSIEVDGNNINLGGGSDTTTIAGNLIVNGTASFSHADNLEVADPFILLNSGSTTDVPFGIVGATSSDAGIGWAYGGGSNKRWTMTTGSDLTAGGTYGGKVGDASLLVAATSVGGAEADALQSQDGNFLVASDEIYVYF